MSEGSDKQRVEDYMTREVATVSPDDTVAAVARELDLTEHDSIDVHPPGGRLAVRFTDRGATLAGPTEREFAGRVSRGPSPTVETDEAAGD